jgi:hypothetical protein
MVASQDAKTLTFRHWHQELNNLLIEQGMQGYPEKTIVRYFKHKVDPNDIRGYLELLLKEDKTQKFKYKRDFWWRATININK